MPSRSALFRRSLVAAALFLVASQPAAAATIMQSAAFSPFHSFQVHDRHFNVEDVATTMLHFAAFDASLGTLTGARWQLDSRQDYGTGLSIVDEGFGSFLATWVEGFIGSEATPLGGPPLRLEPATGPNCASLGRLYCLAAEHAVADVDFDVAATDLAPFAESSGIDLPLGSRIHLEGIGGGAGDPYFTWLGTLDWSGTLSLTYTYDPTAAAPPAATAPEPATWALLILGFGTAGLMLRRRSLSLAG